MKRRNFTPRGAAVELRTHEDPRPWEVYVRGHGLTDDEAVSAAEAFLLDLNDCDDDYTLPRLEVSREVWARWGMPQDDEWARGFYVQDTGGRGAFPVTEVIDADQRDRLRAKRAAEDAHRAEVESIISAWLPEATDVRALGYPVGGGHATFRLPGLKYTVKWRADNPDFVSVSNADVDAWRGLYGGRLGGAT